MSDTFTVRIATSNAAFEGEDRNVELARILHSLASRLENDPDDSLVRLRDINGNRVGYATFNEAEGEV